jgi:hypothetical protein
MHSPWPLFRWLHDVPRVLGRLASEGFDGLALPLQAGFKSAISCSLMAVFSLSPAASLRAVARSRSSTSIAARFACEFSARTSTTAWRRSISALTTALSGVDYGNSRRRRVPSRGRGLRRDLARHLDSRRAVAPRTARPLHATCP